MNDVGIVQVTETRVLSFEVSGQNQLGQATVPFGIVGADGEVRLLDMETARIAADLPCPMNTGTCLAKLVVAAYERGKRDALEPSRE